jgi:hypothetical protein
MLAAFLLAAASLPADQASPAGGPVPQPPGCVRIQLPPGVRIPLGSRLHATGRCDLGVGMRFGERGAIDRGRRSCPGLLSWRCAMAPVSAS